MIVHTLTHWTDDARRITVTFDDGRTMTDVKGDL